MRKLIVITCLGSLLLPAASWAQSNSDLRAATKQVDIMARVLKRGLGKELKGTTLDWYRWANELGYFGGDTKKGKKDPKAVSNLLSGYFTPGKTPGPEVTGRYLPGVGAVFTFETTMPTTATPKPKAGSGKKRKKNDLWDQVEKEMKAEAGGVVSQGASIDLVITPTAFLPAQIRKDALKKLTDAIVRLITEHGDRLDRIPRSEVLSVHVKVKPQDALHAYWSLAGAAAQPGTSWALTNHPLATKTIVVTAKISELRTDSPRVTVHTW